MKKSIRIALFAFVLTIAACIGGYAYAAENDGNEATTTDRGSNLTGDFSASEKNIDLPDSDVLLNDFIESKAADSLRSGGSDTKRTRGQRLTGNDKIVYNLLKQEISKIAEGETDQAIINIDLLELSGGVRSFSLEELIEDYDPGETYDKNTLNNALYSRFSIDAYTVVHALLADLPYQFYWFDKSYKAGWGMDSPYIEAEVIQTEDGPAVQLSPDNPSYVFKFYVSKDYSQSGATRTYTVDTAKTSAAAQAAENAAAVIAANAEKSDYEKLGQYRNYICENVSYDYNAMTEDADYGDPWQLIYVFDGNAATNVVCEGYSKAFQFLCDLSTFQNKRIESHIVTGTIQSDEITGGHMWNIIHMNDGKNYLVDVTNCDEGMAGVPDKLFLRGNRDGSISEGYTFTVGEESCCYAYDDFTLENYDAYELELSETDYDIETEDDESCYHLMTHVKEKAATCKRPGNHEYWYCSVCKKYFRDAAGKDEFENNSWITTENHSIICVETKNGSHWYCKGCNQYFSDATGNTIINRPSNICYQFSNGTLTFYGRGDMDKMGEGTYGPDKSWSKYKTSTTKIVISKGISFISGHSFTDFTNVTSVDFAPTVRGIEEDAFFGCKKLDHVVLPDNMTRYGASMFAYCENLTSVTFGSDTAGGGGAIDEANYFVGCKKLESIDVPDDNFFFKSIDGVLYTKDGSLLSYPAGKKDNTFAIDDSANTIAIRAFAGNPYIENVVMPASIEMIESNAFYDCGNLGRLVIPDSIKHPLGINPGDLQPGQDLDDLEQDDIVLFCPKASIVNNSDFSLFFKAEAESNDGLLYYWFDAATGEPVNHKECGKGTYIQKCVEDANGDAMTVEHFAIDGITYGFLDSIALDDDTLRKVFNEVPVGRVQLLNNPKGKTVPKTIRYGGYLFNVNGLPTLTLSKTTYTWNNKTQRPGMTVKYNGKTLSKTNYMIDYPVGSKNVGVYTVSIQLNGNVLNGQGYEIRAKASYKINPKGTSLISLKTAKKAFTVKWKKQASKMSQSRITGYQIQYSLKKNFKSGNKTLKVKGYKKVSKKIAKLKSKKTYYVRIRTYKTTGGKTYYSNWSAAKRVKVK